MSSGGAWAATARGQTASRQGNNTTEKLRVDDTQTTESDLRGCVAGFARPKAIPAPNSPDKTIGYFYVENMAVPPEGPAKSGDCPLLSTGSWKDLDFNTWQAKVCKRKMERPIPGVYQRSLARRGARDA
jgi:hypothetical protein